MVTDVEPKLSRSLPWTFYRNSSLLLYDCSEMHLGRISVMVRAKFLHREGLRYSVKGKGLRESATTT